MKVPELFFGIPAVTKKNAYTSTGSSTVFSAAEQDRNISGVFESYLVSARNDIFRPRSNYLSDMLREEIGQTAQQVIQNKIIERAKDILGLTKQSIAEIAFELGFQHPQSFNKFFKAKTGQTPVEYRHSLN